MIRPIALAAVLALAVLAVPASAQHAPDPIRLTLSPMATPSPVLKYSLLPQVRDRRRGNAAVLYFRAFSPEWQVHRRDPKYLNQVADSNNKPLRSLRSDDVDGLARRFSSAMLEEVDRAARRTHCDWEQNERLREEGISMLLPDVQGIRQFAGLLKVRARKELLAGRYDQAIRTLQTGLALSRHLSEGPTLIHDLVGIACASLMLSVVDDWIDRPGAPNLYWALTDLPRPLISLRNGFDGERLTMDWLFPGYRELRDDPKALPSPPSSASLQKFDLLVALEGDGQPLGVLVTALKAYPHAKRFLRQRGFSNKAIEAMPALQAVFLYEVYQYDVYFDELRKCLTLTHAEAVSRLGRINKRLRTAWLKKEAGTTLATLLLPAINNVLSARVRLDRKVAALRCVEALRLHASAHGGKLPEKLADVTEVSIPLDPMTGKPFDYHPEGGTATLRGPAPAGEKPDARNTLEYELTIRTAKGK